MKECFYLSVFPFKTNLCISIHTSPPVQNYWKLNSEIEDVRTMQNVEVSKLEALKKQQANLPSRIMYCKMVVRKLHTQKQFLFKMRDFAKSQMTEEEKKKL